MSKQKNQNSAQKNKKALKDYARYSALGFQMLAIILLGIFSGIKLDQVISGINFPLFTLILSIAGVILATYYAIKDFIRPTKK